ncbi:MAG: hypothetical protein PQJ58_12795 [Spirochaetales bacterium]|nr:hypothetical protein [Spirochaetales bacterium]
MNHSAQYDRIEQTARAIYTRNRVSVRGLEFHQPALGHYESLFAWDSGWAAIALSVFDPEQGIRELEALFSFQMDDGRIPHEVRFPELGGSENLFRRLYLSLLASQFDDQGRSAMVDPPSYLVAAAYLYKAHPDRRILNLLPAMQSCLDYLCRSRDILGDGLVANLHPWESGCDMAPYFDAMVGVRGGSPFWKLRYELKYKRLLDRLSNHGWNAARVKEDNGFVFEEPGFNGLTAMGAQALAYLWNAAGEPDKAQHCAVQAETIVAAAEKKLWDEEFGYFFPRFKKAGSHEYSLSLRSCLNASSLLMTGLVSPEKSDRIMREYFDSEEHFKTESGLSFNSDSEMELSSLKHTMLWRGPCQWINMNWMAAGAAAACGRPDLAEEITGKTAALIEKEGFREFYHPVTGEGAGARDFLWPALVLDMLKSYGP